MIGVTGEDLLGSVELLQQQNSSEQMRPSHGAERQAKAGALYHRLSQPFGASDHECKSLYALGAPALHPLASVLPRSSSATMSASSGNAASRSSASRALRSAGDKVRRSSTSVIPIDPDSRFRYSDCRSASGPDLTRPTAAIKSRKAPAQLEALPASSSSAPHIFSRL
jgi:hypothetical protein